MKRKTMPIVGVTAVSLLAIPGIAWASDADPTRSLLEPAPLVMAQAQRSDAYDSEAKKVPGGKGEAMPRGEAEGTTGEDPYSSRADDIGPSDKESTDRSMDTDTTGERAVMGDEAYDSEAKKVPGGKGEAMPRGEAEGTTGDKAYDSEAREVPGGKGEATPRAEAKGTDAEGPYKKKADDIRTE